MQTWYASPLLMLALSASAAAQPELTLLTPSSHTMPFASFENGELTGGVMKDIGESLAKRMGYKARFVVVPGKRVAIALALGEVDGLCFVVPGWIDGKFNWTKPAIPAAGVIVANASAPYIKGIKDLTGERIGTVLGYRYPEVEAILGKSMQRDDAPTALHSLNKLAAGRSRYAIADQMTIEYHLRMNPSAPMRIDYTYVKYKASCAFSLQSKVHFPDVEKALSSMATDGTIDSILARYR